MNDLFEYKQTMNALQFTPEQKEALAEAAASAAQGQKTRKRRPVLRTALIAAALVVVLAVGAGASGVLRTAVETFAPTLGGSVAQTEVIEKIGHPIGASDTDAGLTITADAIIGDQYNACIIYTITRDDGAIFDYEPNEWGALPLTCMDGWIDIEGVHADEDHVGYHGICGFIDQVPGDNAIQYIQKISSDLPLNTGVATATFRDIYAHEDLDEGETLLAKGKWKLRFDMAYEDSAVYLGNGETFSQEGLNFTIDEISVSPIAVRVAYTVDSVMYYSGRLENGCIPEEEERDSARYMENIEMLLTKTDGTVVDLVSLTGGSIIPNEEGTASHCIRSGVLDEIIPLEEMASIRFGGIVYDIPHN